MNKGHDDAPSRSFTVVSSHGVEEAKNDVQDQS